MKAIKAFVKYLNENCVSKFTEGYTISPGGRKFLRVVSLANGAVSSAYCFIEKETGGIYKTSSWSTPAKGERANVNKLESYIGKADIYGGWLYRYY